MNFVRSTTRYTMTDDIVTRLENWDDQQPPFSVMQEAADELKRLRAALEDCERDFHSLKVMFDKMRVGRNYWRKYAEQNYGK